MYTTLWNAAGRLGRTVFSLALFSLVVLLAAGATPGRAEPKYGGRLVFGAENDFAGFDALKARGLAIIDAIANNTIQERLFGLDEEENLVPILGLSASPGPDRKIWTIALRRGVVFHDGTPFNADAVVHHWRRLLNPENRYSGRPFIEPIESVEKVDEYTVRFILRHEWLPFLKVLAGARGLGAFIPSPTAVDQDKQFRAPVGTGPFMFKEWKSGDSFTVVKNPNYWQEGKPYVDEIVFAMIPDHQSRFASLQSGQLDMTWMDRGSILNKAEKEPAIVHYQETGNGAEIFILNTTREPFDNPDTRRALAYAWNQQACVDMSYEKAIPFVSHPFGESLSCEDVAYPAFDMARARQLHSSSGEAGEIECLHSDTSRGREQGELLQQFGGQAGFAITSTGLSFGPIIKKVYAKEYQISTWRLPSQPDMGASLYSSFHSRSRRNVTGYSNPHMDSLLAAQRMETDPERRRQTLCEIARLLNEDAPIIYRGGQKYHILAGSHVKGFKDFRDGVAKLADIWLER